MNRNLVILVLASLLLPEPFLSAANSAKPNPDPESQPRKPLSPQEEAQQAIDYLLKEYAHIWDSPDWLTRCLASMSMARLPQNKTVEMLLGDVEGDKFPIVALVSWECLLGRAQTMSRPQFDRYLAATRKLMDRKVFNGLLRVDLLRVMAVAPPDSRWMNVYSNLFASTSSLSPQDIPVLEEMGKCLATWKSPSLVEALIRKMQFLNDAYRAEYILHAAGCTVPLAGQRADQGSQLMWRLAQADYVAWWKQQRAEWQEKKSIADNEWQNLRSSLLTIDIWDVNNINIEDRQFRYQELEIKKPRFKSFEVAFVVDATGSMRPAMDWLAADLGKMMSFFGLLATEPRISLTFYRDNDRKSMWVARTAPFSRDVKLLSKYLRQTPAIGGGDPPEAVLDGLTDSLNKAGWTKAGSDPRAVVLIGDAPPHPETQKRCEDLVKKMTADRYKFYAVKVFTPYGEMVKNVSERGQLPAFDALAEAAGGRTCWIDFCATDFDRYGFSGSLPTGGEKVLKYIWVANPPRNAPPSHDLLKYILADAVTEQYRDRIQPLVPILLEACEANAQAEKREPFNPIPPPAPQRPPREPNHHPRPENPNPPAAPPPIPEQ